MPARAVMALVLVLAACGGKVVVDVNGAGGAPTTGSSGGTGTTGTGTATTCTSHADCPGGVCVFSTGTCAPACEDQLCPNCSAGTVCDGCATSSCPSCADCLGACVPAQPGRCDGDDPCPAGQVCLFQSRTCAPACTVDADCGSFSFCAGCVTGSCCGCKDCLSACVGGE